MITAFYILGIIGFTVWIVTNIYKAVLITISTYMEYKKNELR